jgi:uncharacterized membrane protein YfhO
MQLHTLSVREKITYEAFSSLAYSVNKIPALLFPLFSDGKPVGYIGQMPLLLALGAFFMGVKKNIHIRFWGIVACISLALAVGDAIPFLNKIMFLMPLYSSFRGAERHIIEFSLALSLLAAFGVSMGRNAQSARNYLSFLFILLLVVSSISGISAVIRKPLWISNFAIILSFAFTGLSIVLLACVLKPERNRYFRYLIIFVILSEIVMFRSMKWIQTRTVDNYYADLFSQFENGQYRVAFFKKDMVPMLGLRHGISLVEGFDPLVYKDYNSLLQLGGIGAWSNSWTALAENNLILSMLNTKYIVLSTDWEIKAVASPYKLIRKTPDYLVYENTLCMPRAFSISELITLDKFEQIKSALFTLQINPLTQAIVSSEDFKELPAAHFTPGNISVTDYRYNRVVLKTDFTGKGFVVLSDHYYPGWKAFIDGKPATIYKTNGFLRGVTVPPGTHELIFSYQPRMIYLLIVLSLLTLIGIMIAACKRNKKLSAENFPFTKKA